MLKINSAWTQGLEAQERKDIEQIVKSSTILLDRLTKILYNMQDKKEATVLADYDHPSWSHKQAHQNGEAAMLRKVIALLSVAERDDPPTP